MFVKSCLSVSTWQRRHRRNMKHSQRCRHTSHRTQSYKEKGKRKEKRWRQRDIKSGRSHATKWLDRNGALLLQVHTSVKLGACQSNALLKRVSQKGPVSLWISIWDTPQFSLKCTLSLSLLLLLICALSMVYQTDSLVFWFGASITKIRKEWCTSPTMTASSRLNKGHAIIRGPGVPVQGMRKSQTCLAI